GRGSHRATMSGIQALRERSVPFEVIAVVTPLSLDDPASYYDYFCRTGAALLGLNVEESEGTHRSSLGVDDHARFKRFARELFHLSTGSPLKVREFTILETLMRRSSLAARDTQNTCGSIVSLAVDGEISTFSPELLGLAHPNWPSFAIAHVGDLSEETLR